MLSQSVQIALVNFIERHFPDGVIGMPSDERRRLLFQASPSSMLSVILYSAACQPLRFLSHGLQWSGSSVLASRFTAYCQPLPCALMDHMCISSFLLLLQVSKLCDFCVRLIRAHSSAISELLLLTCPSVRNAGAEVSQGLASPANCRSGRQKGMASLPPAMFP